jgi:hypothetical protein
MVLAPLAPGLRLTPAGVAERVKLGVEVRVIVSAIPTFPVRLPEVPVIATEDVLAAALLAAVKVTLLLPAVVAPKVAVTPAGRPLTQRLTVPLNPFCPLTVTVLLPLPPGLRPMLAGDAASVKLGGPTTVIMIAAWLTVVAELPITVTVLVPSIAFAAALNVSVVRVDDAALNDAVMPVGKPLTEKATVPLNPLCGTTVIVLAPVPPCVTLSVAGDGVME